MRTPHYWQSARIRTGSSSSSSWWCLDLLWRLLWHQTEHAGLMAKLSCSQPQSKHFISLGGFGALLKQAARLSLGISVHLSCALAGATGDVQILRPGSVSTYVELTATPCNESVAPLTLFSDALHQPHTLWHVQRVKMYLTKRYSSKLCEKTTGHISRTCSRQEQRWKSCAGATEPSEERNLQSLRDKRSRKAASHETKESGDKVAETIAALPEPCSTWTC